MLNEIQVLYFIFIIFIALAVGSFLNVVIYRIPNKMSLLKPSSHCPKCGYKLRWYDNIPLLSYILLKGKCRNCKNKISPRYFIVELLNTILWSLCYLVFVKTNLLLMILGFIFISIMIIISFIDLDYKIIYDRFQIILLAIAIIILIFDKEDSTLSKLLGGSIVLAVLLAFYYIFKLILKREAIGIGDIKLLTICGLLLGIERIFLSVLIGSIIASIFIIVLIIRNKNNKNLEYAFAPYLCIGLTISYLFGHQIIDWYMLLFTV